MPKSDGRVLNQKAEELANLEARQELYSILSTKILTIGVPSIVAACTTIYLIVAINWKTVLAHWLLLVIVTCSALSLKRKAKLLQRELEKRRDPPNEWLNRKNFFT